jgi:hypothetical protein
VQVSFPVFEHLAMVFCVAVDNRENYLDLMATIGSRYSISKIFIGDCILGMRNIKIFAILHFGYE